MLGELRNVNVVTNLYLTRHRWDLSEQEAQQRGLASPIRANKRQLLASLNNQVDVAQHCLTVEAHAGILGFNYDSGRSLRRWKAKPSNEVFTFGRLQPFKLVESLDPALYLPSFGCLIAESLNESFSRCKLLLLRCSCGLCGSKALFSLHNELGKPAHIFNSSSV